ncbi:MAG: carboxy terminal-processing peptidase, partial [Cytophagales bacterium]|nr:carboxy terminal-processing peptidase [Cytophagales bacterium]
MPKLYLRLCFFFLFPTVVYAQRPVSWQEQAIALRKLLETKHYSPQAVDDRFSAQLLARFLKTLDPSGLYFTAADGKQLTAFQTQLDDELRGNGWKFLPLATGLYQKRLSQAEQTVAALTKSPFVFSAAETIDFGRFDTDSLTFVATEAEQTQRWGKWLKFRTLADMTATQPDLPNSSLDKLTAREPAARAKVRTIEQRNLRRLLNHPAGFEALVAGFFLNAIGECFDPHTRYFSNNGREDFQAALSTETLSVGIDLDEDDDGNVVIAHLVPGGPAWQSNELHKGDVLTQLKRPGQNAVDLAGAEADEVAEMLAASKTDKLELTVRKADGLEKTVSLVPAKIRADENIVKSYILKGDLKIGYISLPGFYTEWEDFEAGLGCANDVAKEIVKLKQANVEGLILDIRYNGGGSLREGLALAGIFIDEGPLALMQETGGKPVLMKDMNRGTLYDGPMAVMVNGHSASASELLAGTLQDYNRAVIVGSTTYGKATGQQVLPIDPAVNAAAPGHSKVKSDWGFAKVTLSKLYRVTGKSAQRQGVVPHVAQPDVFETLGQRESNQPTALPADSVNKKVVFAALKPLPVADLNQRSQARMSADESFRAVRQWNDSRRKRKEQEKKPIVLHPASFKTLAAETQQRWQTLHKALERKT